MTLLFKMVLIYFEYSFTCSTSGTAQPSELPGAVGSLRFHALQEICPSASLSEIQSALAASNGNADEAAQQLLGNVLTVYYVLS